MQKKLTVGGQSVIECVMIRSPNYYAVSIRKKGKIITKTEKIRQKHKFLKLLFIRGVANLIEMLVIGIRTLVWSSEQQAEKDEKLSKSEIFWTLALSIIFAVGLFVALPYILTLLLGFVEEQRPVLFNIIDGILKIGIFLAYLLLISLMKDVKRLFEYHGAEHKVVYCYENGKRLSVENAKQFPTAHPRCGTSFIFIVFVFSFIIFALLPLSVQAILPEFSHFSFIKRRLILFPLRIFCLPIIAGISYELLKLSDKFKNNTIINLLISPGLLFQKITTRKPDTGQIQVALSALVAVLRMEGKK